MSNLVLNITQAIQLGALGPCIFIVLYLLATSRKPSLTILPVLFFLSMAAFFLLPVLSLFPQFKADTALKTFVTLNENIIPLLSFLLIIQFVLGRCPPFFYWFIFAIPFIGGGPFMYLAITENTVCVASNDCYATDYLATLYRVFGASVLFTLLIVVFERSEFQMARAHSVWRHKYWLIITLIAFNLLLVAIDLAVLGKKIAENKADFIRMMLGVGFVYVALTSVFRAFSESVGITAPRLRGKVAQAKDSSLSARVRGILKEERPYRKLGFNRKNFAKQLGVGEHALSRVINEHFGKSFSELMNEYRVRDAKAALKSGRDPITVISFDCGFSSITSFNRVFKEATGLSPSDYRKESRSDSKNQQ